MQLTLYYQPGTRAQRVRWMLEELGLDYDLENIDLFGGEGNSEAYLRIHPLGQLPALKIDNDVMIESGAIVQWLAEYDAERRFAPTSESPLRRDFNQWMYFAVTSLEMPAWEIVLHSRILSEEIAVPQIVPFARQRLQQALVLLERVLGESDYLVGGSFSAADIMTGYILMWFPRELAKYQSLKAYVRRLADRPAYQRSAKSDTD